MAPGWSKASGKAGGRIFPLIPQMSVQPSHLHVPLQSETFFRAAAARPRAAEAGERSLNLTVTVMFSAMLVLATASALRPDPTEAPPRLDPQLHAFVARRRRPTGPGVAPHGWERNRKIVWQSGMCTQNRGLNNLLWKSLLKNSDV